MEQEITGVMATNVAEGAKEAGAQADVIFVSDFSADKMDEYDAIAFRMSFNGS